MKYCLNTGCKTKVYKISLHSDTRFTYSSSSQNTDWNVKLELHWNIISIHGLLSKLQGQYIPTILSISKLIKHIIWNYTVENLKSFSWHYEMKQSFYTAYKFLSLARNTDLMICQNNSKISSQCRKYLSKQHTLITCFETIINDLPLQKRSYIPLTEIADLECQTSSHALLFYSFTKCEAAHDKMPNR